MDEWMNEMDGWIPISISTKAPNWRIRFSFFSTQPQQIKDIKQFLEIARRKDAKCELHVIYIHTTTAIHVLTFAH